MAEELTREEIDALPRTDLVFMYRMLHRDGKVRWVWGEKQDDGEYKECYYKGSGGKNIANLAAVGMVFRFPDVGHSIFTGNRAEFVGEIDDGPQKVEWAARDRAGLQALATQKEMNKLARKNVLRDALRPLHDAYCQMGMRERGQFLVWVTRFIMEGKG